MFKQYFSCEINDYELPWLEAQHRMKLQSID